MKGFKSSSQCLAPIACLTDEHTEDSGSFASLHHVQLHWDNCLLTMSSGREAFSFLFESLHWISPVLMDKLLLVEFSTITQWRELSRIFLEKRSPTTFLLTWCTPGYHWSLPTSPFFGRLCTNTGELCIVMHLHKCIQTPRLLLLGVFTMWKGMWVRPCITLHLGWVYMRVMV